MKTKWKREEEKKSCWEHTKPHQRHAPPQMVNLVEMIQERSHKSKLVARGGQTRLESATTLLTCWYAQFTRYPFFLYSFYFIPAAVSFLIFIPQAWSIQLNFILWNQVLTACQNFSLTSWYSIYRKLKQTAKSNSK
jgi:hypothetical protein